MISIIKDKNDCKSEEDKNDCKSEEETQKFDLQ